MASTVGTILRLDLSAAEHAVARGAAYVDLRDVGEYLDVHIPGSISLQYEYGPGMQQRARDCLPLSVPMVILGHGEQDMAGVAAVLRGKGFAIAGVLEDGLNTWTKADGTPASTTVVPSTGRPSGTLLSVGDPGSLRLDDAIFIPISKLWDRVGEVPEGPVTVLAGRGVRAALAVGMLERAGFDKIGFWAAKA